MTLAASIAPMVLGSIERGVDGRWRSTLFAQFNDQSLVDPTGDDRC